MAPSAALSPTRDDARRRMTPGSSSSVRVLVADDQRDIVEALRLSLKGEGFAIRIATSPKGIVDAVSAEEHDVVLMDLNYARDTTSGREGFDLLDRLREIDPTLPVVVMTAWGTIEGAVEAMRRGPRDYVPKPWDTPRLVAMLRKEAEYGAVLRRTRRLEG